MKLRIIIILGMLPLPFAAAVPTLAAMPIGQARRVAHLGDAQRADAIHRLMELGVLPGTTVEVLHRVRDALILRVRGTSLMVQAALAEQIFLEDVQPVAAACEPLL